MRKPARVEMTRTGLYALRGCSVQAIGVERVEAVEPLRILPIVLPVLFAGGERRGIGGSAADGQHGDSVALEGLTVSGLPGDGVIRGVGDVQYSSSRSGG